MTNGEHWSNVSLTSLWELGTLTFATEEVPKIVLVTYDFENNGALMNAYQIFSYLVDSNLVTDVSTEGLVEPSTGYLKWGTYPDKDVMKRTMARYMKGCLISPLELAVIAARDYGRPILPLEELDSYSRCVVAYENWAIPGSELSGKDDEYLRYIKDRLPSLFYSMKHIIGDMGEQVVLCAQVSEYSFQNAETSLREFGIPCWGIRATSTENGQIPEGLYYRMLGKPRNEMEKMLSGEKHMKWRPPWKGAPATQLFAQIPPLTTAKIPQVAGVAMSPLQVRIHNERGRDYIF